MARGGKPTVRLSSKGVQKWMRDNLTEKIRSVGEEVAANARQYTDKPVDVRMQQTDRPRAVVAIAHPAGVAVQAKTGALTRGATEAGLDVKHTNG